MASNTLIIGYGNKMRGDDGIGPYIAEKIELSQWPSTDVWVMQQLQVELVEDIKGYKPIIFIDAALNARQLKINVIPGTRTQDDASGACAGNFTKQQSSSTSTHHLSPYALWQLCEKLYQVRLDMYLVSIPARQFDMTESISTETLAYADKAVEEIQKIVVSGASSFNNG
ncbi:MAG: hydrogenase maturation protease [Candidatus Omnitrophica bacterium]|nr:hydrogenase maturation protease [Candidatus Omnitrophota bacterium]